MDLFEQLSQIDEFVSGEEEKKLQEQLFKSKPSHSMDFMLEDITWHEVELEKVQKAEEKKLVPLSAGFGPWSW